LVGSSLHGDWLELNGIDVEGMNTAWSMLREREGLPEKERRGPSEEEESGGNGLNEKPFRFHDLRIFFATMRLCVRSCLPKKYFTQRRQVAK
jgi:hypothetical protein